MDDSHGIGRNAALWSFKLHRRREIEAELALGRHVAVKAIDQGRWTAEWRIPFASLGIDPARTPRFAFSLSLRKTGGPDWVLWVGTNHATWNVNNAGDLELK